MDRGPWSSGQRFMTQVQTRILGVGPQVILKRAHKIEKKLPFEGECSNVVIDSHVNGRLLS
jgi:hypothetical protein